MEWEWEQLTNWGLPFEEDEKPLKVCASCLIKFSWKLPTHETCSDPRCGCECHQVSGLPKTVYPQEPPIKKTVSSLHEIKTPGILLSERQSVYEVSLQRQRKNPSGVVLERFCPVCKKSFYPGGYYWKFYCGTKCRSRWRYLRSIGKVPEAKNWRKEGIPFPLRGAT